MRCVPAHHFTVNKAIAWKGAVFDDPPYQRQSSVWGLDKQQRFVDTLLNGFDVPKIYLHDLRGQHPTKVYAVVDGKQRLNTIWRFVADEIPLAPDFRLQVANAPDLPPGTPRPRPGDRFSELDRHWQDVVRTTHLSVVLIQNATLEDIEELFARLNNGAPLNAAERRNARGGAMAKLIRQIATRSFFRDRLPFPDIRYGHLELATRLLLLEHAELRGAEGLPDLGQAALDRFVEVNRTLTRTVRGDLIGRLDSGLERMERVFGVDDPLLGRPPLALLHYLVVRAVTVDRPDRLTALRDFLERSERAAHGDGSETSGRGPYDRRRLARRVDMLVNGFRLEQSAAENGP